MSQSLPSAVANQSYVTVHAIVAGSLTLPDRFFVSPADEDTKRTVPSLAFLITHAETKNAPSGAYLETQSKPCHLLFDLGLRRHPSRYLPIQQKHLATRAPYKVEPGIAAQLRDGGVNPSDIDAIILSHVHYDHHGDPEDFPTASFLIGHGAKDVLSRGLGGVASHQHFDPSLFDSVSVEELPDPDTAMAWKPFGPFPKTLDLFGDGSVYVVDTPGHLPGHVNLLCRTRGEKWVALCGDSYHDARLLSGEKQIGTWKSEDGHDLCIHLDKEAAQGSIDRLRELQMAGDVEMIASHDDAWLSRNEDRLFPRSL